MTPESIYYYYQKYICRIKVFEKPFHFILEKASLVTSPRNWFSFLYRGQSITEKVDLMLQKVTVPTPAT